MHFTGGWILLFSCIVAVSQNETWTVGSIQFVGNKKFSSEELLDEMQLQPPGLFKKTDYSFTTLAEDIDALKRFYRQNGFRNTTIRTGRIYRNSEYLIVEIEIRIKEGVQTRIDTIIFKNSSIFSNDSLLHMLPIKMGDPFDSVAIERGSKIITDSLNSMGFLFSELFYETNFDSIESGADIIYNIKQGPLVKMGSLEISGHRNVKEQVISRELLLHKGQILSSTEIARTISSLYNTGLFNLVSVEPADTPRQIADMETVSVPVQVRVSESEIFELLAGGGYSTDDGLYGDLSAAYRNLFGLGHRISFSTRASFDILSAEISYTYPRVFNLPVYADLTGYLQRLEAPTFSGAFGGAILSLNGLMGRFNRYRTYLQAERVSWIDEPLPIDTFTDASPRNVFILGAGVTRDTRRSIVNPGRAVYAYLDAELAGFGIIPWSSNFYRIRGDVRVYFSFPEGKISFSSAFFGGYAHEFSGDQVPAQEQFYFGSQDMRLIRGYSENELNIFDENGNARGGNFALVITPVEIVFPLFSILHGAVFLDGGNVSVDFSSFQFSNFNWSVGPGIRIATPIGPVRLDYGIKLDGALPLDGGFSFGIGLTF